MHAEAVEGEGKQIAILTGVPGALNLQERDQGSKDALSDKGVDYEIAVTVPGSDDLSQSVEAVARFIRAYRRELKSSI